MFTMIKMPYKGKIDSICHHVFQQIMAEDDISFSMLYGSLDVMKNKVKVFNAGEGSGASGSFFFFSHDNRFIIKTLQGNEKETLVNMINSYADHLKSSKSLIARIYGLFRVKTAYFYPVDIIIMQNTSHLKNKKMMKYRFDLKGSTVGRRTPCNPAKVVSNLKRAINISTRDTGESFPIYEDVLKDINF